MDIKLKNNNRNNGAGNNNVSASNGADGNSSNRNNGGSNSDVNSNTGKNSGADSNAGNSNNRNNGGSNSNAVNSSKRIIIAIAGIIFITIITMCFFPVVYRTAERQKEQQKAEMMRESSDSVDNDTVQTLYQGSYVLYVEQMERSGQADAGGLFLNLPTDDEDYQYVKDTVTSTFDEWKSQFESDSWNIDYCVYKSSADCVKNTDQPLETCVDGTVTEKIKQYYTDIVCLSFDKEGALEVTPLYDENISGSVLIKAFQNVDRENLLGQSLGGYVEAGQLQGPKDFKVIFGLPVSTSDTISLGDPYEGMTNYWVQVVLVYRASGGSILFLVSLAAVAGWMFLMTSRRIWNEDIPMQRPGKWYLMEVAVIAVCCMACMEENFYDIIRSYSYYSEGVDVLLGNNAWRAILQLGQMMVPLLFLYGIWYAALRVLRPVFSMGVREYIRQYSLIYQIFPWLKKLWNTFRYEVAHVDFSEKSTKTIWKIVLINFAVLSLCSMMWFFGIGALIVYSIFVFCFIKKYYDRIGRDYQALLRSVSRMADGDLDTEITEDLGIYEPMKVELSRVRDGFKKAVDEEVKSQRMKTDLITNVSHDLKTPLTVITTYVELLKKEDITEEERRSYIETLDKKSQRLKILIEDLFEVSKATSNNIVLHPMEVDVVNLLNQVAVEHTERFAAMGLTLRWDVPEEKVIVVLDNQKTFRIFENLFVNIQKYAMPQSRVYVQVHTSGEAPEEFVEITIKNMSATELNFDPEEITERFVRGDTSRGTEGSGLGLAIARSFTEAQGGKLSIEVDGDLFKVVIRLKCGTLQVEKEMEV